jgi:hypothetical protein
MILIIFFFYSVFGFCKKDMLRGLEGVTVQEM